MEYAHRYGAKAVVVHPGEVPFPYNIDKRLKELYHEYGRDSEAYGVLWREMLKRREALAPYYLARIQQSLEEASEIAARKGWSVIIGIETRSRCYQMPTLLEAKMLCDSLRGSQVRLWYDIGHAKMMERMGLYPNEAQLSELLPYIYGVHIHETLGLSDHWCPYVHSGDPKEFDPFLAAIAAAEVKVYELKARCEPESIRESHSLITTRLQQLTNKNAQRSG